MVLPALWNAPQACLWFASRDEVQVRDLKKNHTFAELAMETEVAWDDLDDPEVLPPLPGWIVTAQEELLAACLRGDIKLMGRPSSGGVSEEIPGPACATARFFCLHLDRGECLGPPGTPPGDYWTDLQVAAEDVRRVWPADRSAAAASSPSIPAIVHLSPADQARLQLDQQQQIDARQKAQQQEIDAQLKREQMALDDQRQRDQMRLDTVIRLQGLELPYGTDVTSSDTEMELQRANLLAEKTETKHAPRKAGAKRFQRAAAHDYLKEHYPNGVPDEVSVQSIRTALREQGKAVSPRTIRRAMGRK
jgi:hypothetical protein